MRCSLIFHILTLSFLALTVQAQRADQHLTPKNEAGKWGYADKRGKFVRPPLYDWAGPFQSGRAWVSLDSQVVLIDRDGNILDRSGWQLDAYLQLQEKKARWTSAHSTGNVPTSNYTPSGTSNSNFPCPPNLDWELGNYTNWTYYVGSSQSSGSTYVLNMQQTPPVNNRHVLYNAPVGSNDFWGGFPRKAPNSGQYAFKLGNDNVSYQAEAATYKITVPPTPNPDYSVTYQYAVVLENPQSPVHQAHQQPALRVRLFYLNAPGDTVIVPCGSFEYVASLVGVLPGFSLSPLSTANDRVWYKPWSSVYINLSKYPGRELFLEFTTADCSLGAHFGYAYFDVSECGVGLQALSRCTTPASVRLEAPPGFQSYTWYYNNNFSNSIGSGQTFTVQNPGPVGSSYQVIVQPYNNINCASCNCSDTFNVAVPDRIYPTADAGPDRAICVPQTVNLGAAPVAGQTYSWSPATGLSSSTISNPVASPATTTSYVLTTTIPSSDCSSKDTVVVSVNPKPLVQFSVNNTTQCVTGNQFNFSNQSSGTGLSYQWNFGDGNVSTAANPVHTYTNPNTYQVTLYVTNAFNCIDSLKRTVTVLPNPTGQFAVGPTATQCLRGNVFSLSVTNPIAGYQYSWDMGNGLGAILTGSTAQYSYTQPGNYTVSLIIANAQGCVDTVRVPVQVNPAPTASFTINNPIQCLANNLLSFTNTSQSTPGGVTYNWDFGVAGGQSNQTNPTYTYPTPGTYNVQLIVSGSNQCRDTTIRTVTIHPTPQASLLVPPMAQCLSGNAFTFTNQTTIPGNTPLSYQWNFGDNTSSTVASPTHSYAASGTYTVTLLAVSNQNCSATATGLVTVLAEPSVQINQRPSVSICSGETAQLTSTVSAGSGTITQYQWNLNGQPISGAINSSISVTAAGQYSLTVTNSNRCVKNDSVTVIVNPLPTGSLAIPSQNYICEGQGVTLTATGGASYSWYLNNNLIPGVTGPTLLAIEPGSYSVEVFSAFGCRTRVPIPVVLSIYRAPVADFTHNLSCVNTPIQFNNRSQVGNTGPVSYTWTFGDGNTSTVYSPIHTYATPSTYTATLTVQSTNCSNLRAVKTSSIKIVAPLPNVRYPSQNTVINTPLQLQARPIGIFYQWSPPRGLSNPQRIDPIFNYNQQQEYLVRIQNQSGCVNVDTVLVRVFANGDIFVPNAYTPNGDGLNDRMYPILVGMMRLNYFRIFNRWGHLVFETRDPDPSRGWDGRIRGKDQPLDTYTWTVEAVDPFGKVVRRNGNFVLIR